MQRSTQGHRTGEFAHGADLMSAMDELNRRFGRETLALGAAGIGARSFDTKRAMKSPAWTTRIDELPLAR